jgi:DNA-binding LacI/PurR family transcriptional regulator
MPVVWVNTMGVGDCVCPDDRRAGHDATESLLRLGHRRIAFVDQPGVGTTATPRYCNYGARLEGYRTAMKAAGLKPWLLCVDKGETPDAMLKAFRCILASSERPTGLVICRKHEAQAAIFASYTCPGLQVPRDLSMVTFTDELPGMAPVVTAWVTPWKIMGRVSIETLMARMRAPEADSVLKFIPMEMAPGTTCDKPPVS